MRLGGAKKDIETNGPRVESRFLGYQRDMLAVFLDIKLGDIVTIKLQEAGRQFKESLVMGERPLTKTFPARGS